jgi:hypothetical protein
MKTHVLLIMWMLIGVILMGCPKNKTKINASENTKEEIRVFDAKLIEINTPHDVFKDESSNEQNEGWNDFMYVCKYQVVNSLSEDVKKDTIYPVIISKNDPQKHSFIKTVIGNNVVFEKGVVHHLTVTVGLPEGWDAIKDCFSDDWPSFLACLKVESVK